MSDDAKRGRDLDDMLREDGVEAVAALLDGDASMPPPVPPAAGDPCGEDGDNGEAEALELAAAILGNAREVLNDTGNGQRLLRYFGRDLLHVRGIGWHAWAKSHWNAEGGDESVVRHAQITAARIALEADVLASTPMEMRAINAGIEAEQSLKALEARDELTDEDKAEIKRLRAVIDDADYARALLQGRKKKRRDFSVTSGNTGRLVGMVAQALPHRTVTPDDLDSDALKFNVENGTLQFVREVDPECPDPDVTRYTWRVVLLPHDRDDLMSKAAPVMYDPDAECPMFMAFLDRFQPVLAIRAFIQAYHGYAMTGLTGEQCLMYNYGLGANGKSTLVEIVARIMGGYAMTLSFESLAGEGGGKRGDQATPDIARLPGARLVRASEPDRDVRFKESLIKSLTGGEPMLARHMHKGFFEFRPDFKLVLSGNTKPEIGGVDHGIWRRMRLVPWTVTIPESERRPIEEVLAEFWEERSGILNWLIEGTLRYLQHGLVAPQEIIDATAEYREEMDPVGSFVRDCITRVPPGRTEPAIVQARPMYQAFVAWCYANSVRPWREKTFGSAMSQKGFARGRTNATRFYVDVELHDVPNRPSADEVPPHPGMDEPVPY